jgi:hydrogenase maturation factor HypF (carbamoyltransferase family)
MANACSIRVRGVVQGVGFRPFVYRLARANTLSGWVLNGDQGVEIHLEADDEDMETFVREMQSRPPAAASISDVRIEPALCQGTDWIHNSGEPPHRAAYGSRPAGSPCLRRLPSGMFRL